MKNKDFKISILIPAYKPTYLKECIDSVLTQSYKNFELIVVNDHSPFDIDSILASYTDNRINYYKNEKGFGAERLVQNWNKCLEYAKGDYLICMGDDDKLLSNCLYDYIELINKYPDLDVYHTQAVIINELSKPISIQEARPEYESVYACIWHLWQGQRQFIGDWLFKTTALRKKGGFFSTPYAWAADHLTVFSLAAEKGIANMQTIGFQYRENRSSITQDKHCTSKKVDAMLIAQNWHKEFLKESPSNNIDKIYRDILKNNLASHIAKRIATDISKQLANNPFAITYWLTHKKQYQLNKNIILKAIAYAIAERFKR